MFLLKPFIILSLLFAQAIGKYDDWQLQRFTMHFENDYFTGTDRQYSAGGKFSLIYLVPEPVAPILTLSLVEDKNVDTYVTFSLINQIFTPSNVNETNLIVDDRPYAGWTYLETGIHKSSKKFLHTIYLQVGVIGPASQSEHIKNGLHRLIGDHLDAGWDNQLKNELGVNLRLVNKWRFTPEVFGNIESAIIPFIEGSLGNVSTQATAGLNMRFGWNIPKDFGVSNINTGGESNIPIYGEYKHIYKKPWSFSFNLSAAGSAVARDITLDGNTFRDSHSVDKHNFIRQVGLGVSLRYNKYIFDFMQTTTSKRFKTQKNSHSFGTASISWLF